MHRRKKKHKQEESGEFLWLVSLSDLMILLFIFFVTLYSFAAGKMKQSDIVNVLNALGNKKIKDPVSDIQENVSDWVKKAGLEEQIVVKRKNGELLVEIKDQVFFSSGKYALHERGQKIMTSLARAMGTVPKNYRIGIEGHTDDTPVRGGSVESNWELSAKRALSVMNSLRLPPDVERRTVIQAYGSTQPLYPNRDAAGRPLPANQSKNRRVTLKFF
jgi:chemotaxis protein MotB